MNLRGNGRLDLGEINVPVQVSSVNWLEDVEL